MKDPQIDLAGIAEIVLSIHPVKFKKSEKNDLIVLTMGNKILREIRNCKTSTTNGQC